MPMPDVLFALTGDVRRNSRALRQLQALVELGASIEVVALADDPGRAKLSDDVRLRLLRRPAGSGARFFWRVHRAFRQSVRSTTAAVYHASDLYNLPAMHAAAAAHDGALAFDSRELYPFVASTSGRPWIRWFWQAIESVYIPRADAVFTVSDSIARALETSYDIEPPTVLYNVPARENVEPSSYLRQVTGIEADRPIILHQGSVQKDRGCEQLVEAVAAVENAALVFLGEGPLKKQLQEHATGQDIRDRVYFVPPVPPEELLPVTASADIGVTLLRDTCRNHRFALPNKLFEYLMAGLPVVASRLPEISRVVEGFDVGRTVDPVDPSALAAALQELVDHTELRQSLSSNAPDVFDAYSWEEGKEKLQRVYSTLLSPRR